MHRHSWVQITYFRVILQTSNSNLVRPKVLFYYWSWSGLFCLQENKKTKTKKTQEAFALITSLSSTNNAKWLEMFLGMHRPQPPSESSKNKANAHWKKLLSQLNLYILEPAISPASLPHLSMHNYCHHCVVSLGVRLQVPVGIKKIAVMLA